jgi:hypothetical protein
LVVSVASARDGYNARKDVEASPLVADLIRTARRHLATYFCEETTG